MSEFEHWRPRYRRTHPASRRSGGSGIQTRTRLAPDRISFLVKLSVRRNVRVGGLNLLEFEGGLGQPTGMREKDTSNNDERARDGMEALLNRQAWNGILPAANASCHGCGGRGSVLIRTRPR